MPEVEEKQVFDGEKASLLVKELRKNFNSGRTKSYEWRISQLESIAKMLQEKEKDIIDALKKDLSKPAFEAFISEVNNYYFFLIFPFSLLLQRYIYDLTLYVCSVSNAGFPGKICM